MPGSYAATPGSQFDLSRVITRRDTRVESQGTGRGFLRRSGRRIPVQDRKTGRTRSRDAQFERTRTARSIQARSQSIRRDSRVEMLRGPVRSPAPASGTSSSNRILRGAARRAGGIVPAVPFSRNAGSALHAGARHARNTVRCRSSASCSITPRPIAAGKPAKTGSLLVPDR